MKSVFQLVFVVFAVLNVCSAQLYSQPLVYSPSIGHPRQARVLTQGPPIAVSDPSQLAHPANVENSIAESQLPPELLKSHRFYSNPATAAALARESWLTDKESPVFDREAEKIPRDQIFKIFKNAGFLQRRRRSTFYY